MSTRRILLGGLAVVAFVFSGCGPKPRLDRVVAAESARDFSSWQTRNRDAFNAEEWAEFEAALQDIKLKIIALGEATGTEAVNDALRPKIHQRTVRDVLRLGYETRLWRLSVQVSELGKMLEGNATLRTNPGDTASRDYLVRQERTQRAQLDKALEEVRVAEAKIKALAPPLEKK